MGKGSETRRVVRHGVSRRVAASFTPPQAPLPYAQGFRGAGPRSGLIHAIIKEPPLKQRAPPSAASSSQLMLAGAPLLVADGSTAHGPLRGHSLRRRQPQPRILRLQLHDLRLLPLPAHLGSVIDPPALWAVQPLERGAQLIGGGQVVPPVPPLRDALAAGADGAAAVQGARPQLPAVGVPRQGLQAKVVGESPARPPAGSTAVPHGRRRGGPREDELASPFRCLEEEQRSHRAPHGQRRVHVHLVMVSDVVLCHCQVLSVSVRLHRGRIHPLDYGRGRGRPEPGRQRVLLRLTTESRALH
eukprot:scaffold18579_cov202-Isochrysis_galbana.AAC.1